LPRVHDPRTDTWFNLGKYNDFDDKLIRAIAKCLQVSLFLWMDRPKDHREQGFDFLLVCRHQNRATGAGRREENFGWTLNNSPALADSTAAALYVFQFRRDPHSALR
jgi:hypothetical protein